MAVGPPLLRISLWAPLLIAVGGLWIETPSGSRTPAGVSILADVPYGSEKSSARRFTIIAPSIPDPPPHSPSQGGAILAIHGGSWIGGSRMEYVPQLTRLARHGFTVFAADYSLARPGRPSWPAALEDLREAVRWIRRNGERYHANPARLAILGSGSGGHLALILANDSASNGSDAGDIGAAIRAVVSLYAPTDLEALVRERNLEDEPARILLGDRGTGWPGRAQLASPIALVGTASRPTMLIHGLDDSWVRAEQSRRYDVALGEAGVPHRLLLLPGARHGFELQLGAPSRLDLLPKILDFLNSVMHN